MTEKPAVLFVCLGNICRSPLAEATLRQECAALGLDVEIKSAGTGNWHVGQAPDHRAQRVAKKYGIDISGYKARQITQGDFYHFTHIIALDHDVLASLEAAEPQDGRAEIALLLDYVEGREGEAVADPYYGHEAGFEITWADVSAGAKGLARLLAEEA